MNDGKDLYQVSVWIETVYQAIRPNDEFSRCLIAQLWDDSTHKRKRGQPFRFTPQPPDKPTSGIL